MRISLLPRAIFPALTQISPDYLRRQGIRLLMLDFDNTIVPYTTDTPSPEMERWLRNLAQSEIQVCVVSNSKKGRVQAFCSRYGLACITHARNVLRSPSWNDGIVSAVMKIVSSAKSSSLAGGTISTIASGSKSSNVRSVCTNR